MLRSHEVATTGDTPLNQNVQHEVHEGVQSSRFSALCEDVGILHVMGVTLFTMARILEKQLSREASIELAGQSIALLLCAFGVLEEEATRIANGSAKDIIGGEPAQ